VIKFTDTDIHSIAPGTEFHISPHIEKIIRSYAVTVLDLPKSGNQKIFHQQSYEVSVVDKSFFEKYHKYCYKKTMVHSLLYVLIYRMVLRFGPLYVIDRLLAELKISGDDKKSERTIYKRKYEAHGGFETISYVYTEGKSAVIVHLAQEIINEGKTRLGDLKIEHDLKPDFKKSGVNYLHVVNIEVKGPDMIYHLPVDFEEKYEIFTPKLLSTERDLSQAHPFVYTEKYALSVDKLKAQKRKNMLIYQEEVFQLARTKIDPEKVVILGDSQVFDALQDFHYIFPNFDPKGENQRRIQCFLETIFRQHFDVAVPNTHPQYLMLIENDREKLGWKYALQTTIIREEISYEDVKKEVNAFLSFLTEQYPELKDEEIQWIVHMFETKGEDGKNHPEAFCSAD